MGRHGLCRLEARNGRTGTRRRKWPSASPKSPSMSKRAWVQASATRSARAPCTLFNEKGQDTLFRLHGTPEWASIGTAASSGCIRLMNQDVIDLYSRVRPGKTTSKVIVIQ